MLGFGRAFRAAGAGGVVASLWSLNDRATAEVTATFYRHLADGKSKPLALRRAQLEYLRRTDLPAYLKSPYYWAALTYYGDAGALPVSGISPAWWAGVMLFVPLGVLLWRWQRSG